MFGEVTWLNSPATSPGLMPLQGTEYPLDSELAAIGWTRTISPTKVNELRIGWTRNSVFDEGISSAGLESKLGITGTGDINGVPNINIPGSSGFGTGTGLLGDVDCTK